MGDINSDDCMNVGDSHIDRDQKWKIEELELQSMGNHCEIFLKE
jgi:hypothetical protein